MVWQRRATSLVPTPSAASNSALAWTTLRCPSVVERAIFSSADRCSLVMASGGAVTSGHGATLAIQAISATDH